jgi:hypothetical protein
VPPGPTGPHLLDPATVLWLGGLLTGLLSDLLDRDSRPRTAGELGQFRDESGHQISSLVVTKLVVVKFMGEIDGW